MLTKVDVSFTCFFALLSFGDGLFELGFSHRLVLGTMLVSLHRRPRPENIVVGVGFVHAEHQRL